MANESTLEVVQRSPRPNATNFHAIGDAGAAGQATATRSTTPAGVEFVPTSPSRDPPHIRCIVMSMGLIGTMSFLVWIALRLSYSSSSGASYPKTTQPVQQFPTLESMTNALREGVLPVRGVNLAGWLVAEHAITWDSPLWQSVNVPMEIANQGEYKVMEFLGHDQGDALFRTHRETWITEKDIEEIAKFGLNTVRVPVGFWIMGSDETDVANQQQWRMYAPGALLFLDKLIHEWSPKYKVAVMISLHAHKGSQNGEGHSAPLFLGEHDWHLFPENMRNSLLVAQFLAHRYSTNKGFLGLSLMNEPTAPTDITQLKDYYLTVYDAVRRAGIQCALGISPLLSEQNGTSLDGFMMLPTHYRVWQEVLPRFVQSVSESIVIKNVTDFGEQLRLWKGDRVFISEWTLASQSLAFGFSCQDRRRYGAAQMEVYNKYAHSGWAYWTWRHANKELSMQQNLRDGCLALSPVSALYEPDGSSIRRE